MPLEPKQQPPYYTPGTTPTPGGQQKFVRLNEQHTNVITSGTTEQDLYTYTLPANTLTANGDGIEIDFNAITSGSSEDHIIRFYIDNTLIQSVNDQATTYLKYLITASKTTSNSLYTIAQSWSTNTIGLANQQSAFPLDFTQDIEIKFTGQCTGTATIQTELMTIDKKLK